MFRQKRNTIYIRKCDLRAGLLFILSFPLLLFILNSGCKRAEESDREINRSLKSLDKTIIDAGKYIDRRMNVIDSLKREESKVESEGEKCDLYTLLSTQYRQLDSDSAIKYAMLANSERFDNLPGPTRLKAKLTLVEALSTSGIFGEAFRIFNSINFENLNEEEKILYWKTARMLYSYSIAYISDNNLFTDNYRIRYRESDDSLLNNLSAEDPFYKFILSEKYVREGEYPNAKLILDELISENPQESNLYGMSAYQLAEIYRNKEDIPHYIEALSMAAQSDIMGGIREGIALPTLATLLYETGDLERAFKYMSFALAEANEANIRIRTVSLANNMGMIDQAYNNKLDSSNSAMKAFLIIACCLLAIAFGLSGVLIVNIRKSKRNEERLAQSSLKLRDYVGNFIGLCSNYSSRMEQLGKLVTRKVKADQAGELIKLVGSGRFAEEDNEEFYKLIDKAFTDIFPDFIESINHLLQPDKKITSDNKNSWTPELRIYACVRLGVDQSARIAQILNYSVNTVYSYRNRMRNRAINRETFDKDVMNLGWA